MDLSEAIDVCKTEGVLSTRTADLCSVIKSYRNLIHPGRVVRFGEAAPSEGSAKIALAVVDLIVDEITKTRKAALGLTAEQILSKLRRDENALAILTHLLGETSERERERLLIELIPATYFDLNALEDPFGEPATLRRLERAYRVILENVADDVRRRAAEQFVRVLREDDGYRVSTYSSAFFRPEDLRHLSPQARAMVRQYLLGRVGSMHSKESLAYVDGIAEHLAPSEVPGWLDPFVRTLKSAGTSEGLKERVRKHLVEACLSTNSDVDKAIDQRMNDWIKHLEKGGSAEHAAALEGLKEEIASQRLPF